MGEMRVKNGLILLGEGTEVLCLGKRVLENGSTLWRPLADCFGLSPPCFHFLELDVKVSLVKYPCNYLEYIRIRFLQ